MVVFLIILLVLSLWFLLGGLLGAPWVPARALDITNILEDCQLKPGEIFIELGCGDGRQLVAAAQRGAICTGYEINPLLCLISYVRTLKYRKTVRVKLANFWKADLSNADMISVFLVPRFMDRLEAKLKNELAGNSRFISYIFPLPGKKPKAKKGRWYIYVY